MTRAPRRRSWFAPLNPPVHDWRGQVVWLVGASSGIGRATAHELHARGAQVVVSARNRQALDEFVAQHPGALAIDLDVTDRSSVAAAARTVLARHGRVDLAMYCAGHYRAMRAVTHGEAAFDLADVLRHEKVNVLGAWHLLDVLLPTLTEQGHGHLAFTASVAGYSGLPNSLAYGPTKAALIHLAEALYLDLSPAGIGVSLVNPGFVETPLTARNEFHMPALISPEKAAREIVRGWEAGLFEIHFPRRFTRWLKFLRLLPYRAYFWSVARVTGG